MPQQVFVASRRIVSAAIILAAIGTAHAQSPVSDAPVGDAAAGKAAYAACLACHALDANGIGPKHRGLVGRKAGAVEGYKYSPALRKSEVVWTPQALESWLQDPRVFIEGARMFFSVPDAKERADIIAYLASEK